MKDFIEQLDVYFGKKAPQLPVAFKEVIVKFAPQLAIVGAIMFAFTIVPMVFLMLGVGGLTVLVGDYSGTSYAMKSVVFLAIQIVSEVMIIISIPGLFSKSLSAWNTMFYVSLLQITASLVQFNLGSAVIGFVIQMYILFQIRSYYTGVAAVGNSYSSPMNNMMPPTPPAPPTPPIQ